MLQFLDYLPQIDFITYSESQAGFLASPVAALIMGNERLLDTTFLFFYN
ncbi:hypothetical protein [Larkinella arboricola]|uniref:Uncharacterized protein n=1 Tax=Larkinella arboricola TaxID=643671 RepID=A0A327WP33_LARAB|nr:hypothetical protein [Larkinella arboricola]RAJ94118.1 hypothetical protein LX87_04002 [Larkinella arboricola]